MELVAQALAQTSFRTEDRSTISAEELRRTLLESYWMHLIGNWPCQPGQSSQATWSIVWLLFFVSDWTRTSMLPVAVSATHSGWLVTRVALSGLRLSMPSGCSRSNIRGAWHVLCFEPSPLLAQKPQLGCLMDGHVVHLCD